MTGHVEESLPDYLVDAVGPDQRASIAAHLAVCPDCARALGELQEVYALLTLTLDPLAPEPDVRARMLDDTRTGRLHRFAAAVATLFGIEEARARLLLDAVDAPGAWEPSDMPGVRQHLLPDAPERCLMGFILVPSGGSVPLHEHHGREQTLVLQGRMRDDDGRLYRPGELMPKSEGTRHTFVAEGATDLLCGVVVENGWTLLS
jgi:predicted ChrR family anti-sigma factor